VAEPRSTVSPIITLPSVSVIRPAAEILMPVVAEPKSTMSARTMFASISMTLPEVSTLSPVVAEPISTVSSRIRFPPESDTLPCRSDVPVTLSAPVREVVTALTVRREPAPPLRGERVMLPVVLPPKVRPLFLRDWILASEAERTTPLLLVEADKVAIGAPPATPVMANLAAAVLWPPIKKSRVELLGTITPPLISAKGEEPAPPVWSVPQTSCPEPLRVSLSVPCCIYIKR